MRDGSERRSILKNIMETKEIEIQKFEPFINKLAKKFATASRICNFYDLKQAGYVGLLNAHNSFNQSKNKRGRSKKKKWNPYAFTCIKNAIITESMKHIDIFTLPKNAAANYYKIKKLKNNDKLDIDIIEELNITKKHFKDLSALIDKIRPLDYRSNVTYNNDQFLDDIYEYLTKEEKELLYLCLNETFTKAGKAFNITSEWARVKYNRLLKKIEWLI